LVGPTVGETVGEVLGEFVGALVGPNDSSCKFLKLAFLASIQISLLLSNSSSRRHRRDETRREPDLNIVMMLLSLTRHNRLLFFLFCRCLFVCETLVSVVFFNFNATRA
jgi:hypothetical protein